MCLHKNLSKKGVLSLEKKMEIVFYENIITWCIKKKSIQYFIFHLSDEPLMLITTAKLFWYIIYKLLFCEM